DFARLHFIEVDVGAAIARGYERDMAAVPTPSGLDIGARVHHEWCDAFGGGPDPEIGTPPMRGNVHEPVAVRMPAGSRLDGGAMIGRGDLGRFAALRVSREQLGEAADHPSKGEPSTIGRERRIEFGNRALS